MYKKDKLSKNSGIYTITNLVNNKLYVGFCSNFRKREKEHRNDLLGLKHPNCHLQNSCNKYGIDNFSFDILVECAKDLLFSEEHYWATLLDVHNRSYGYNISPTNPNGNPIKSLETIEKQRIVQKKKYDNGYVNPMFGKTHSLETRKLISLNIKGKTKGRKMSDEQKLKISTTHINNYSEERRENARILGKRIRTLEDNKKLSLSRADKTNVYQYSIEGKFIRKWTNRQEVKQVLNYSFSDLGDMKRCSSFYLSNFETRKCLQVKGYIWIISNDGNYGLTINVYKRKKSEYKRISE